VQKPSDDHPLASWYQGQTLMEALENARLPVRSINKPLRVSIYDYYKAAVGNLIGDCVQAKVESGMICLKDQILLMPHDVKCTVKTIEVKNKKVGFARPGTICELALNMPSTFDPVFLRKGNVLCSIEYPTPLVY